MDRATFMAEVKKIVSDHELVNHPYVELVSQGKAAREQLKRYPIEHYAMTVKESAPLTAVAFLRTRELDLEAGEHAAQNSAEEALGLYSHSTSHTELLFEMWERALGMPRRRLIDSIGSDDSRAFNALYRIPYLKPHFMGAIGLMEEMEVRAYKKLMLGMQEHYGIKAADLRFLEVHYEADKQHSETGHYLIDRFVTGNGREKEFLAEALCLARFFWRGFDSMLKDD